MTDLEVSFDADFDSKMEELSLELFMNVLGLCLSFPSI
jgi:hypothetical protein